MLRDCGIWCEGCSKFFSYRPKRVICKAIRAERELGNEVGDRRIAAQDVTCPVGPVDSAWSGRWYLQRCAGVGGRGYNAGAFLNPPRVPVKRAHRNPLVPGGYLSIHHIVNDKISLYSQGEKER